eukprot:g6136.t1
MDENFDPNCAGDGSKKAALSASVGTLTNSNCSGKAVPDADAPLREVLGALEDGRVAIAGDLVAIRAGPDTYHPIKALKGMASESDVIILSCLTKAPATTEATSAVCSALQRVIVRTPLATIRHSGPGGLGTAAAAGGGVAAPNLRAIFPSAHSTVVDSSLLRAFTVTRARTILAGLSSLTEGGGVRELPTIVAGIAGGPAGLCFLGQRATSEGYSAFSIRRDSDSEGGVELAATAAAGKGQVLRIDDLINDFGGHARASVRALYDLWGTSNGDVLGAALQDGATSSPFARLATEWDCSSHATRTLGSPPPPACSSLLLIGGVCPPSSVSLALRASVETLSAALVMRQQSTASQARRRAKGPFGVGVASGSDTGAAASTAGACDDISPELDQQEQLQWREDLQALLNGSENMAELAARPINCARGGNGNNDGDGPEERKTEDEDTAIQERKDGGGLGEDEPGSSRQDSAETLRGDLDFSERLWELAARATDVESVRSAVSSAFDAVGDGQIFPVISRDNRTAAGSHIRDGVALAREARYHDGTSVGAPRDEAKAKAWRERGSAMLADTETLARAFVELGVHKVSRDLLHGLEVHAGILAADVNRVLPAAVSDRSSLASSDDAGDRRLDRLLTLADTLDLVALAQSYGAPWRQVRALAHSGLATLRRSSSSPTAGSSSSTPSPVFSLGLPKPIPSRARCKLAHPLFWELCLESTRVNGVEGSAASGLETVSYTIAYAGLFQLNGVDEPPVLSGEAARAAQAALRGVAEHLIPEVLSSVAGVESFGELKRRQLDLSGASNGGHSLGYTYSPLDYSSSWQQKPQGLVDAAGASSGSALDLGAGGGGAIAGKQQSKTYRLAVKRTMVSIALSCCFGLVTMMIRGQQSGLEFFAGYLVEQSLSVDNLFVFLMTFDYFQVPLEHQGRVLTWGIVGAILMRGVMIAFGVAAVKRFEWITVVFAAILLVSSYKLLVETEDEDHDLSQNTLVRMSNRLVGAVDEYDGDRFFTRLGGKGRTVATPLLLCLVCIELSDFVFAVDSIPAVLGISQDPFIVFSSNLFAIMGLRSIYVIIAQLVSQLPYLKPAVALVLGFVGCKMLLEFVRIKISTGLSLLVVLSLISGGVALSLVARRRQAPVVKHKRRHSGNASLQCQNGGGGGEGNLSGFV